MRSVILAGVVLAVLVAVVSLALGASGMHQSSPLMHIGVFFGLAILLNIGCVVWGLKMTAAENTYPKQLLNAAAIGLVAGLLIFAFSFLMLSTLMPNYIEESTQGWIEFIEAQPSLTDAQIQEQVAALEGRERTPMGEARGGLIGTFITSLVVGAIAAIFLRKK